MPRLTTRTGPGHRTTAVPMRRQVRVRIERRGSSSPNSDATVSTAGASVSAATSATATPMAAGGPMLWKYGNRVKLRHDTAPTTVRPEPRITCAVP